MLDDFRPTPVIDYVVRFCRAIVVSTPYIDGVVMSHYAIESQLQLTIGLRETDLRAVRGLVDIITKNDYAGWRVVDVVPASHIVPFEEDGDAENAA
jgi:hypothetical protein